MHESVRFRQRKLNSFVTFAVCLHLCLYVLLKYQLSFFLLVFVCQSAMMPTCLSANASICLQASLQNVRIIFIGRVWPRNVHCRRRCGPDMPTERSRAPLKAPYLCTAMPACLGCLAASCLPFYLPTTYCFTPTRRGSHAHFLYKQPTG